MSLFNKDGHGTSVIIACSKVADLLIQNGVTVTVDDLHINVLPHEAMLASQQGSFNHRHYDLHARIKENKDKNIAYPQKDMAKNAYAPDVLLVQKFRRITRKKNLINWKN